MRTWVMGMMAAGILLTVCGCERTHEDVLSDSLEAMKELSELLEGVTDKESAEAAAPEIKKVAGRLRELSDEMDKITLTDEQQKALESKYGAEGAEIIQALSVQRQRVLTDPELRQVLRDALN